jgi:hypothetical protein
MANHNHDPSLVDQARSLVDPQVGFQNYDDNHFYPKINLGQWSTQPMTLAWLRVGLRVEF